MAHDPIQFKQIDELLEYRNAIVNNQKLPKRLSSLGRSKRSNDIFQTFQNNSPVKAPKDKLDKL